MNRYETALHEAWDELVSWVKTDKIRPTCEEEIQCFLYRCMVENLGDALHVKPKPGRTENQKLHFPDFILGENQEVVVEIKFSYWTQKSSGSKQAGIGACLRDVEKMFRYYHNSCRYFLLFEASDDGLRESNLNKIYLNDLQNADQECHLLIYPPVIREEPNKRWLGRHKKIQQTETADEL